MRKSIKRAAAVTSSAIAGILSIAAIGVWGQTPTRQTTARQTTAEQPKTVRLYVFDLGKLTNNNPAQYRFQKDELAVTDLAVAGYLIVHPRGTLIWDTGVVPDGLVGTGARGANRAGKRTLKDQLAEIGYAPKGINFLGLSHYHFDHTGNANAFQESTWLVRQEERDAMFAEKQQPGTTVLNQYNLLKDNKTVILDKDEYDVFGDGTVIVKAAVGHTPGHQVLVVKLAQFGPVILAGDLYHYREERALRDRTPTFEFNSEQTIASRDKIEAYAKKIGAQLWIEHDLTHTESLKKSPDFYE
jgi:glyoxylase-like metal-dependent hydrolase (beta-lactamase superfamily II)